MARSTDRGIAVLLFAGALAIGSWVWWDWWSKRPAAARVRSRAALNPGQGRVVYPPVHTGAFYRG